MTGSGEHVTTKVVTAPVKTRRRARAIERIVTRHLDFYRGQTMPLAVPLPDDLLGGSDVVLPPWAKGVRVERAGFFQFVVVATSTVGH